MTDTSLYYTVALALTPNLGPMTVKKLVAYCGNVEDVYKKRIKDLVKIPGLGKTTVEKIDFDKGKELAESELKFCEKHNIKITSYLDKDYPKKLSQCPDSPIVIFTKGNLECLNKQKMLSIVGTRNSTMYGKMMVENLIRDIKARSHDITIVSGLAYGIDVIAHRACISQKIPTAAILGHGLDKIYPAQHRSVALDILKDDGILVTEFQHNSRYEKSNFLRRNRIIAGLSDAVLIAESGITGGALVTADYAQGYNRDVFAFPGKIGDQYSAGCNKLIKRNKAALCEGLDDIEYIMNWDITTSKYVQLQIFEPLSEAEQTIFELFEDDQPVTIDYLAAKLSIPVYRVAATLLEMEFKGVIMALPGNQYRRV
ncbi:MAG TPA: DNA-processing protein DprA [Salinivirgaceae bacterium]|nr:DNA-processing protein DprA [Salinivirgaceae bacterium]